MNTHSDDSARVYNNVDTQTGQRIEKVVPASEMMPPATSQQFAAGSGAAATPPHGTVIERSSAVHPPSAFERHAASYANHDASHDAHAQNGHAKSAPVDAEIARTRDEISATIDAISAKLSPKNLKASASEAIVTRTQGALETVDTVFLPAWKAAHGAFDRWRYRDDPKSAAGSSRELKPLNEQIVVVFGASSGIGRETALEFARRGAKVVVAGRSEKGLDSLLLDIAHVGGQGIAVTADVTDFSQVQGVAAQAVKEYGRLDTWVHCAAVSLYAPFEQSTPEEFQQVIEVNLVGAAHGAMAALPHLRRTGKGALIVISSVEGRVSLPLQSAYASSKHGIIGFLDALRQELAHDGVPISVTNVMPSGINTPFFEKARTKMGVKPQPMAPIYQPSVVTEVILHAAQHPTRDIVAGGGGRALIALQKLSPALVDKMMSKNAYEGQQTASPRAENAPDNLYGTLDGPDHIGGDFSTQAKNSSKSNWLETHPQMQTALKCGAVAVAALLILKRR